MSKRRVITIDNGGSELRYIANSDGREIKTMDKLIRKVEFDGFRVKDNIDPLDIIQITRAPKQEYEGIYALGVGYYMYDGVDVVMSNQAKKTNTLGWYQQVILAIATDAMNALRAQQAVKRIDVEDENSVIELDYEFDYVITTLIPVHEHSGTTDYASKLKESLEGDYEAIFPAVGGVYNTVRFSIRKNRIGVLPEGVVAMASLGDVVEKNDHTLIIDMGHVTTDLSLCRGTSMIGNAVVSSPFAGGTLLKLIMSIIRDKGCAPNEEMAIEAFTTNKFRVGRKEVNIEKEMEHVKKVFVTNYIKKEILNQIELAGITASSIQYVVPLGAVLGVKNPSDGSYDILQNIIDDVNLENAEVKIISDDLRHVNIEKAADFCSAFAKRV